MIFFFFNNKSAAGQTDINVNGLDHLGQLIAIECSLDLYLCDFVFIVKILKFIKKKQRRKFINSFI